MTNKELHSSCKAEADVLADTDDVEDPQASLVIFAAYGRRFGFVLNEDASKGDLRGEISQII